VERAAAGSALLLGDSRIPAPCWPPELLGGRVLLGIRPEDIHEAGPAPGDPRFVPLAGATVTAVEPLGAETLVVLALPGVAEELIARAGRETSLRPGDAAPFLLDTAAIHLFDPATTRVIPRAAAPP